MCSDHDPLTPLHSPPRHENSGEVHFVRPNQLFRLCIPPPLRPSFSWTDKPRLRLNIKRSELFENSVRDIMRSTPERLKLRSALPPDL